jgi:maleylpyruvate isomerase
MTAAQLDLIDPAPAARWSASGTATFLRLLAEIPDDELDQPTLLPEWSRRRLVSHVAANAEGLGRLVTWARTGEETPMYASADDRTEGIDRGTRLPTAALRAWAASSADALDEGLRSLTPQGLAAEVVTAQGRAVPASQVVWMRAREVNVHAVDLATGFTFDELEPAFTRTLITDVVRRRTGRGDGPALRLLATDTGNTWRIDGTGQPILVPVPLARLAGWLTGRENRPHLPALPAWL